MLFSAPPRLRARIWISALLRAPAAPRESGSALFPAPPRPRARIWISALPRGSTWGSGSVLFSVSPRLPASLDQRSSPRPHARIQLSFSPASSPLCAPTLIAPVRRAASRSCAPVWRALCAMPRCAVRVSAHVEPRGFWWLKAACRLSGDRPRNPSPPTHVCALMTSRPLAARAGRPRDALSRGRSRSPASWMLRHVCLPGCDASPRERTRPPPSMATGGVSDRPSRARSFLSLAYGYSRLAPGVSA